MMRSAKRLLVRGMSRRFLTPAARPARIFLAAAASLGVTALTFTLAHDHDGKFPTANGVFTHSLAGGRQLAYCVQGEGPVPVFAFHGMGSSHLTWSSTGVSSDIRVIALDRPGYGQSDDPPRFYSYAQFAADVIELADALGLDKFCVAGHSSGGPCALAVAALYPDRVVACAAISSDAPFCHPDAPMAVREDVMSLDANLNPAGVYGLDPLIYASRLRENAVRGELPEKLYAWQRGPSGWVNDFTLERIPWSFRLEDITMGERCTFWVGGADFPQIIQAAPFLHSRVSGSQLKVVPGGGHSFKNDPKHLESILQELCVHWRSKS